MRTAIPTPPILLAVAALALSACARGEVPEMAPILPQTPAIPFVDISPDPTYTPPANAGDIRCSTINNSATSGPIRAATLWGLEEWRDFASDSPVQPPVGDQDTSLLAADITEFCGDARAGTVFDAVTVFLSGRPGSVGQSFGNAAVPTFNPEGGIVQPTPVAAQPMASADPFSSTTLGQ
ncbi:hypothetical protein [Pelagovum pacificum]|uniref:Uncharacterized protein n=1 Tax=Pelagovum pacificum TaxID=2588711 RepID=A0A5C5GEE1_9RHOB|nr:hypothetical protein [Pelagovum pacificum]QQA43991.1 hypothetical protein I8N54_05280 [Pelagovum pacificum]TNY32880.1 hypothetical protein FHY64_06280 [Pelagovum pacificum]